jgi:hypothetical protein
LGAKVAAIARPKRKKVAAVARPKRKIIGVSAIAGMAAIAGAVFWFFDWKETQQKSRVLMEVLLGNQKCDDAYPLYIVTRNASDRTVERIHFSIEGKIRGSSTAVFRSSWEDERTFKPNDGFGMCWAFPNATTQNRKDIDPKTLEWTVSPIAIFFAD